MAAEQEIKRQTAAARIFPDVANFESYGGAVCKLENLVGVRAAKSTLRCHGARIERGDVKERKPPARRVLEGIDGTDVPMPARPVRAAASLIPPSAATQESPEPSAAADPARKAPRRRFVRLRQRLRKPLRRQGAQERSRPPAPARSEW